MTASTPSSRIEAVAQYLVLKALAGRMSVIKAIYDYFVNNESPSTLSRKYGLSKHQIRGYVQRIIEKSGSSIKAKVFIAYLTPYVMKIKPLCKRIRDDVVRCILCGDEMPHLVFEDHIMKYHSGVVKEYVFSVLDLVSRSLHSKQVSRTHEVETP